LNCQSATNKLDEIEILAGDRYNFILLTETWLRSNIGTSLYFKNYNKFYENRPDGYGGVAILTTINGCKEFSYFKRTNSYYQSLALVVGSYLICCVYRMHTQREFFLDFLKEVFEFCTAN